MLDWLLQRIYQWGVFAPFFVLLCATAGCTSYAPSRSSRTDDDSRRAPASSAPIVAPAIPGGIDFDSDKNFNTAYFGIRPRTCFDLKLKRRFAQVESFLTARPAPAEGFLQVGDRIVEYNGVAIRDAVQLSRAIETTTPYTQSEFIVLRNEQRLRYVIRAGSYTRGARLVTRVPDYLPECK